jgi:hypothetical protein
MFNIKKKILLLLASQICFISIILIHFFSIKSFAEISNVCNKNKITDVFVQKSLSGVGPWLYRKEKKEALSQNQPNPASVYTVIYFYVEKEGHISLTLYDFKGKYIGYFIDDFCESQTTYRIFFPTTSLGNGIYYYCYKTEDKFIIKKMVIAK